MPQFLSNESTNPEKKEIAINGNLKNGDLMNGEMKNGEAKLQFDSIADTVEAFKHGQFIIVLDSISRENEGDLIIAAEDITTEKMGFMIRYTSGLICCPISSTIAAHLSLPQMVLDNTEIDGTAYTVSIDAVHAEMTTGISAHDRALTCRTLASPLSTNTSFRRPGHVFPLQARDKGVLERSGHTEATIEFCKLAGKRQAGAISELVIDGEKVFAKSERKEAGMMTRDGCLRFGKDWGIKVCTIEALQDYLRMQKSVNGVAV